MNNFKTNCVEHPSGKEYGIDIFSNNLLVRSVNSITENIHDINKLVNMLNELEIELCHFDDIIEDYLTDFNI